MRQKGLFMLNKLQQLSGHWILCLCNKLPAAETAIMSEQYLNPQS